MEPPHSYLREPSGSVVHHADYLDMRADYALCGLALQHPDTTAEPGASDALCPDCQAKLVVYHLHWWRQRAEAASKELEELRAKYGESQERTGTAPHASATLQGDGDIRVEAPTESAAAPTTVLDRARGELTELCRQFDGAVPYWRLKKTMQSFSDRLDSQERVLLADEIGAGGSLLRWATDTAEKLGWQVANSPIQENSEMMWEEWLQEAQQPAPKTKRRFGRSR